MTYRSSVLIFYTIVIYCGQVRVADSYKISTAVDNTIDKLTHQVVNNSVTKHLGDGSKKMDSAQLISYYGYPVDKHTVHTEDGYILGLFRISGSGPPVLIFHGLISSSDDFLTLGSDRSLPVMLAARGYDVWLGNARGNTYSRKNLLLSPDEPAFWKFSWHEIGIYDCPATIDYILSKTGASNLTYIGHSQGTTAAYVMLSERTEYNEKVNLVISMASISYLSNAKSPLLQAVAGQWREVTKTLTALGVYEVLPHRPPVSSLAALCGSSELLAELCLSVSNLFVGFDYPQIDQQYVGTQLTHAFAGSSLYQILHYLQNCASEGFDKYDFGEIRNMVEYGSATAPAYSVHKITAKMAFIYSDNDWLSDPKDVQKLISKLNNVVDVNKVAFPINHLDYLWAKDADTLIYLKVIQFLDKHSLSKN